MDPLFPLNQWKKRISSESQRLEGSGKKPGWLHQQVQDSPEGFIQKGHIASLQPWSSEERFRENQNHELLI